MRFPPTIVLALLVASATACSPYGQRGETLYHDGRFIEAAEVFELTEARLDGSPSDVCAEYGLYRGMTFLRLDDLRSARHWLSYAFALERKQPGTLSGDERTMLEAGWRELESRSRTLPPHGGAPEEPFAGSEVAPVAAGPVSNGHRSVE
jgi:hypothetical protein